MASLEELNQLLRDASESLDKASGSKNGGTLLRK